MTETQESISAMIGDWAETAAVCHRILQTIFPLLLTGQHQADGSLVWPQLRTIHNWLKTDLEMPYFNRSLIKQWFAKSFQSIFMCLAFPIGLG